MKTTIAEIAKAADVAVNMCISDFKRLPRGVARETAERHLLIRLAAKANGISAKEVQDALVADEERLYDLVIRETRKSDPALAAAWDDRKAKTPDVPR